MEDNSTISATLDVEEAYGLARSFRRGSTTAAKNTPNEECSSDDIDINNGWKRAERAGTRQATMRMSQLYTDTLLSRDQALKYSACL